MRFCWFFVKPLVLGNYYLIKQENHNLIKQEKPIFEILSENLQF